MITDPPPAGVRAKKEFDASDSLATIELPPAAALQSASQALADALATGEIPPVQRAGDALLRLLADFYAEATRVDPDGARVANRLEEAPLTRKRKFARTPLVSEQMRPMLGLQLLEGETAQ